MEVPAVIAEPDARVEREEHPAQSSGVFHVHHEHEHRHDHSYETPPWRLAGVVLAFGALGLIGWWLNSVGHVDDAATLITITLVYTIAFWARRQKLDLARRLGPFGQIGVAIVNSQEEISRWVAERTLLAGVMVASVYGLGIVLLRAGVAEVLGWFASPWLAGALGCAVGAAVISPELWRAIARVFTKRR